MSVVLQGNMNGTILANKLLAQWVVESNPVVVLISKQYRHADSPSWVASENGRAVVWVPKTNVRETGIGQDCAWAKVENTTFVSVYLSPNITIGEYEAKIAILEDTLREIPGAIVVGGDFNARAVEWGMPVTKKGVISSLIWLPD